MSRQEGPDSDVTRLQGLLCQCGRFPILHAWADKGVVSYAIRRMGGLIDAASEASAALASVVVSDTAASPAQPLSRPCTAPHPIVNTARALLARGRVDEARAAVELLPENTAGAALVRAGVFRALKRLGDARAELESVLQVDTSNVDAVCEVLVTRASELCQTGDLAQSLALLQEAVQTAPDTAGVHFAIACYHSDLQDFASALPHYRRVLELEPHHSLAHCNIGVVLKHQGQLEEAVAHFKQSLEACPDLGPSRRHLAIALTDLGTLRKSAGSLDSAVSLYEEALHTDPRHSRAYYNLGVVSAEQGHTSRALVLYSLAAEFDTDGCGAGAEALNNTGVIYKEQGLADKAIASLSRAIEMRPDFTQTVNTLTALYTQTARHEDAHELCAKGLLSDPLNAEIFNTLGILYREEGKLEKSIAAYQTSARISPNAITPDQNYLYALNCIAEQSHEDVSRAHIAWGESFTAQIRKTIGADKAAALRSDPASLPAHAHTRSPRAFSRPIRVGYLSPDFFTHSVSYFIEALLRHHHRDTVEVYCYSNVPRSDSRTELLKSLADHWRVVHGKPTAEAAQMVADDQIDVLVDLAGHTAGNRLDVMALRPSPVQVSWIGYINTTGLAEIDYRIVDEITDPTTSRQLSAERVFRLPRPFLCYTPSPHATPVRPTPALRNGFVTFGTFNSLAKMSHPVRELWCKILRSCAHSRLLMKTKALASASVRADVKEWFETRGISASRIDFLGLLPSTQHYDAYGEMDISLDTFPYSGATTTCESLYQGVPCVTLASSDIHCQNLSSSILHAIGGVATEWVCSTGEEYLSVALQLAQDPQRLNEIRVQLRESMRQSKLCDGEGMASAVEQAFVEMCEEKRCDRVDPHTPSDL